MAVGISEHSSALRTEDGEVLPKTSRFNCSKILCYIFFFGICVALTSLVCVLGLILQPNVRNNNSTGSEYCYLKLLFPVM